MSHQVVITFDIDETKVTENAEREAGRQIAKDIVNKALGGSYYADSKLKGYVKDAVEELIKEHKDEIIEKAVKEVSIALSKTKSVREKIDAVVKETKE